MEKNEFDHRRGKYVRRNNALIEGKGFVYHIQSNYQPCSCILFLVFLTQANHVYVVTSLLSFKKMHTSEKNKRHTL